MIDFACLGGNKCGTTWLYEIVRQHPQLNVSINKEPHYFSRNYDRGNEWYRQNWRTDERPRGEFSTSYLYSDKAIRRMAEDCPDVCVIVMLRHPVDRAVSHLRHVMRSGTYDDVHHALDEHPEVVKNSQYADRIAMLEEAFGADHVFLGFFPDLKNAPTDLVARVFSFLDVDKTFTPEGLNDVVGKGYEPRFPVLDRIRLAIYWTLKQSGFYSLIQLVKRTGVTKIYKRLNDQSDNRKDTSRNARELLQRHRDTFRADLHRLSQLVSVEKTEHIENWISSL